MKNSLLVISLIILSIFSACPNSNASDIEEQCIDDFNTIYLSVLNSNDESKILNALDEIEKISEHLHRAPMYYLQTAQLYVRIKRYDEAVKLLDNYTLPLRDYYKATLFLKINDTEPANQALKNVVEYFNQKKNPSSDGLALLMSTKILLGENIDDLLNSIIAENKLAEGELQEFEILQNVSVQELIDSIWPPYYPQFSHWP